MAKYKFSFGEIEVADGLTLDEQRQAHIERRVAEEIPKLLVRIVQESLLLAPASPTFAPINLGPVNVARDPDDHVPLGKL